MIHDKGFSESKGPGRSQPRVFTLYGLRQRVSATARTCLYSSLLMVAAAQHAASIITFAPAKLNVFLELHGRRPDGFHELQTVMLPIDCRDRLRLAPRADDQIVLRCRWAPSAAVWRQRLRLPEGPDTNNSGDGLAIPVGRDNLVVKALTAFRAKLSGDAASTAVPTGFDVDLVKNTPAGAGMGGASSDAAAAIRAAAAFSGISLEDPRLWELAAQLGSDVPFFLGIQPGMSDDRRGTRHSTGGAPCRAVLATGRGETLSPIAMHGDIWFVICYPPQPLSTAEVYRNCRVPDRPNAIEPITEALMRATSRSVGESLFNRLWEPARALSPHVERILQEMRRIGLAHAQMTGSGSACFAIAPTQRRARRATQLLSSRMLGVTMTARSIAVPTPIIWQAT